MKRLYIVPVILAFLTLILIFDTVMFAERVNWSIDAPNMSGTGLYLFMGALEINDRIPYCDTPEWLIGLCVMCIVYICITVFAAVKINAIVRNGK